MPEFRVSLRGSGEENLPILCVEQKHPRRDEWITQAYFQPEYAPALTTAFMKFAAQQATERRINEGM